jgi:hypothetical protein
LDCLAVRSAGLLTVSRSLLRLLRVVVLLEVLLRHLALDDHQTGVDERLLEKLALEHSHEVLDSNVLSRRSLDDSTIGLDLLLLSEGLLRVCLALLLEGSLMLLQ